MATQANNKKKKKDSHAEITEKKSKRDYRSLRSYLKNVPHSFWKVPQSSHEILIIGTAHVSVQSVKDVDSVFSFYQPNVVAVELCKPRFDAMMLPNRWKNLDLVQVIKQKKIWLLASSLILSAFQKKLGEDMKSEPGMEMKKAILLAKKNKSQIILADREVRVTLSRAWSKVGFFSRMWLVSFLISSLLVSEGVSEEDVEELKSRDALDDILNALPKRYAPLKEVILNERDIYIAENIRSVLAKQDHETQKKKRSQVNEKRLYLSKRILVVLGVAHLKGVERILKKRKVFDLEEISSLPKRRFGKNIASWGIFGFFFFGISAIFYRSGLDFTTIRELAFAWVMSRSIGAGLGSLLAYPTLPSFLLTVLFAPISYFFGFVGVRLWMVSTLVELRYRKPRVADFENIAKDIQGFRSLLVSLYKNRVLHILFLMSSVSIGLTIGNLFFLNIILNDFWNLL